MHHLVEANCLGKHLHCTASICRFVCFSLLLVVVVQCVCVCSVFDAWKELLFEMKCTIHCMQQGSACKWWQRNEELSQSICEWKPNGSHQPAIHQFSTSTENTCCFGWLHQTPTASFFFLLVCLKFVFASFSICFCYTFLCNTSDYRLKNLFFFFTGRECQANEFRCSNTRCIPQSSLCDTGLFGQ